MKRLIATLAMVFVAFGSYAEQQSDNGATSQSPATATLQQDSTQVKSVVSSRFLPTTKRIDREISKGIYAYKGEIMLGMTVSYGNLSSDNTDYYFLFHVQVSYIL